jgi:hypothetical protein
VDKIGKITASSGEFLGRRLTTTSVLTCGSHLSAKKKKRKGYRFGMLAMLGRGPTLAVG